jgi:glycerol-3-phosphate dehydrogenase
VHGTDGSQYHSGVKKGSSLPTWVDALYRTATIVNENSLVVNYKGMELYRFVIPESLMQNASLNPDNAQYYMSGPSGAINISSCAPSNIPIFMTKPHFLGASPAGMHHHYTMLYCQRYHPSPNLMIHAYMYSVGLCTWYAPRCQYP